jgi:hypothetical protein
MVWQLIGWAALGTIIHFHWQGSLNFDFFVNEDSVFMISYLDNLI